MRFQISQRAPKRFGLVRTDPLDEMHQRRLPAAGVSGLIQGINHEPGDEFVTSARGRVAVSAIIADLGDQVLFGQPLQHSHHCRIGQVAPG